MGTFGNALNGTYDSFIGNYRIRGGNYTFNGGAGQQADSISARLRSESGSPTYNFKGMLYKHSDSTLVGTTDSTSTSLTTSYAWKTFPFSSKPALVDGTEYVIVCWIDTADEDVAFLAFSDIGLGSVDHYTDAYTYNGAPNPISFNHYVNADPCIYCTYSASGGGVPISAISTHYHIHINKKIKGG
jgi:hypothetical protein